MKENSGVRASFRVADDHDGAACGREIRGREIRCQLKCGLSSSFLPEKIKRHRITPPTRTCVCTVKVQP